MLEIVVFIGVFVFVTLWRGGLWALEALEKHKAEQREPDVTEYTGPLWSRRGRPVD